MQGCNPQNAKKCQHCPGDYDPHDLAPAAKSFQSTRQRGGRGKMERE